MERRCFELRESSNSRLITGITMMYKRQTKLAFGHEMFMPGVFGDVRELDIILNLQHQRVAPLARTGGGGLELDDNHMRLMVRAELPETRDADDTLELIRTKVLRGLSIEFDAIEERFENRVRIIDKAILYGVGVVDRPAYADATVQARALGLENLDGLDVTLRSQSNITESEVKRRKKTWL